MRTTVLIILVACSFIKTQGQDRKKLDSLWQAYNKANHDTIRIKLLNNEIGEYYKDYNSDSAIYYYSQAISIADKSLPALSKSLPRSKHTLALLKAKSLRHIGYVYYSKSNYEKAGEYYKKSLKISEEIGDKEGISIILLNLGSVSRCLGNYFEALDYFKKSMKIAEEIGDKQGMSQCYNNFGIVYTYQGSYDIAIENYKKSLKLKEELKDKQGIANCYINYGIVYMYQGIFDKSLESYMKALKIFEELGDKKGIGANYTNIGNVHRYQGNNDKAIEYYQKGLKMDEEMGDKYGIADNLTNIGIVYGIKENYVKAKEYFLNALKIREEIGDKFGQAKCYTNISVVYKYMGDYDKAIEYNKKSLKINEDLGSKSEVTIIYINIATLHFVMAELDEKNGSMQQSRKHLDSSIFYANRGYDLALETGAVPKQSDAASQLQTTYTKLGKYKEAIKYANIYISTLESMFTEEKTKALAEMGTKYETEKKQLQIDNLNKENALKKAELAQSEEKRKRQSVLIYSFVIGFVIILVFSLVIFRLFMQKKRANVLLNKQKQQISIQNSKLQQANEEVTSQRDEIESQRDLVMLQKSHIERIHKEVTDSISYAKRLQNSALPKLNHVKAHLSDIFILFKPKDVVSGDFYWYAEVENQMVITVADCTGHGVPGAFMSMMGISMLKEIVVKEFVTQPDVVLRKLRKEVIKALGQKGEPGEQKDGMDISLCSINKETLELQWAGANNPCYIVRNGELRELKADKMPIAIYEKMDKFTLHEIQLEKGDIIYLFGDGYHDQFGGPSGKKFMSKRFKELLLSNSDKPLEGQKEILEKTIESWKNGYGKIYEQTDDITIMGIKI